MITAFQVVLLVVALLCTGGAGSIFATVRLRQASDGAPDVGMAGIALVLLSFGAMATAVAVGWWGIPAFGGAVLWVSYVLTAQQLGLFRIEVGERLQGPAEPSRESREIR